ncbi:MAG: hypothetical protein IIA70_07350 [Proteobacteria bacterium]|nr:hypothetical protein [Pseudomonadota bacterium]
MNREILATGMAVCCPDCGRKLCKVGRVAKVLERSCAGCGQWWAVEATSVNLRTAMFQVVTTAERRP